MIRHRMTALVTLVAIYVMGSAAFALQSDKSPYDGSYQGKFSGTFAARPTAGSVAFSVAKNVMTVTGPGAGTGTVDASGAATFSGSLGVQDVKCEFTGAFRSTPGPKGGMQASGAWKCTGAGQTGTGMWNANRQ